MKVLMFTDQEIWDILKILSALLHMGNIKYKGKVIDNLDATDIPDQTNVERVASILGTYKGVNSTFPTIILEIQIHKVQDDH